MSALPPVFFLTIGAILFALGFYCLAAHRSAIRMLMGVELMLNASLLNFVAFGAGLGDRGGATFAVMIMAGAAAEAAVGLALVFALYATTRRSDMAESRTLAR